MNTQACKCMANWKGICGEVACLKSRLLWGSMSEK